MKKSDRFKAVMKMPDGTLKFMLNIGGGRPHFLRINDQVAGFKVLSYERRPDDSDTAEEGQQSEILTLQKGDNTFEIIKGIHYLWKSDKGIAQQPPPGDSRTRADGADSGTPEE